LVLLSFALAVLVWTKSKGRRKREMKKRERRGEERRGEERI